MKTKLIIGTKVLHYNSICIILIIIIIIIIIITEIK